MSDRTSHRDKKLIYHLTAVSNLPGIRKHGLLSRRTLAARGFTDVADPEILEGRSTFDLDAMVPFHLISCSPFDYAVVRRHPGESFALLAVDRARARSAGWKIIPRHPLNGTPEILDWDQGVQAIDWSQMDKFPRSYEADHECKMVCMAEALSPTAVPLSIVKWVYVPSAELRDRVEALLGGNVQVSVNDRMFPRSGR